MRKPPTCDVPGCEGRRMRWQRLCASCYRALSGELRVAIAEAHHQRRWADWKAACARAADYLNIPARNTGAAIAGYVRRNIPPERAFELAARLLGERG